MILLDWLEPWNWVRQLRNWIRFLKSVISALDDEVQDVMTTTMTEWQQRKRGELSYETSNAKFASDGNVNIPLSQGEWDEALGLPLSVVCHGV